MTTQIRLREMVEEIDDHGEGLTWWEVDFIASLIDRQCFHFTRTQAEIIQRIYEDRVRN